MMSANTEKKAQRLINSGSIEQVAEKIYQVKSSTPGKVYIVMIEPPHCQCVGFVFRKECSHLLAAQKMADAQE